MDFSQRYGPTALVAGASEGLGAAYARGLAARGLDLLLLARREGPLQAFAEQLRSEFPDREIATAAVDLGRDDLIEQLAPHLSSPIGLLVTNACFSPIGRFLDVPLADKLTAVDVNVRGLLRLLEQLAPPMVERGRGGLLLMSSMSGFQGTSMVGTYAGTKAFVTVLGESLWQELGPQGVDVLVCAAGATLTPNFKDQTPVKRRKQAMPMEPRDVAEGALDALGRAGPTWVPGATNRLAYHAFRLLGRRRAVSFVSATTDRMYRSEP